jgi:hypothetical protein
MSEVSSAKQVCNWSCSFELFIKRLAVAMVNKTVGTLEYYSQSRVALAKSSTIDSTFIRVPSIVVCSLIELSISSSSRDGNISSSCE